MSEDFFGDLGRSITKATKKAASRTGSLIETTKINAQITGEMKSLEALTAEIGSLIVGRIDHGQMAEDEELAQLMEEIRARRDAIRTYRLELAGIRGMELCESCGELVEAGALFCPHCGAAVAATAQDEMEKVPAAEEALTEEAPAAEKTEAEEEPAAEEAALGEGPAE